MEVNKLPKRSAVKQTESPIEDILLGWFLKYNVHAELQYDFPPYRADFAVPNWKLIIEADGKDFHSSPEQTEYDNRRDEFMRNAGWKVMRFSGAEIKNEPWIVVKKVIASIYHERNIVNTDFIVDTHDGESLEMYREAEREKLREEYREEMRRKLRAEN